jgi:glycosyltransferase involved in cell wall biosynthesis
MRVTIVTETYAPQVNGVSRTLGHLVRYLASTGDAVQVIHPDYGEREGPRGGRIEIHRVRSVALPFYKELHLPLPPFGQARRAFDEFGPDLVHIATEATLGLSLLRHALKRRIPTVSSFHTNFDQYSTHYRVGWANGMIWRYLRWFHNATREIYVPSRTTIAELEGRGFRGLVLWKRGVDGRLFRPDREGRGQVRERLGFGPEHVVVGHVSRIAAEKNVGFLADALEVVASARPEVRFLFVGDGPARADIEGRLGSTARFVGYRAGEELADHYAAADLFAFASLTETFGNVVLEAMASGLPVVAVRAGGVGEIVQPGVTGAMTDPEDPPARFAEALIHLVDDREGRRRMAEAARSYALTQTWDAIMGGLRERYRSILGDASTLPLGSYTPR